MSAKMHVPELRFGEFSGEWEEKNFEDTFSFSTGKNIKQNEASPKFETPCVRYGELYHMYGEVISKIINRTNLDKSELLFSKGNEILLPSAGEDPLDIGSASALTVSDVAIGRTINILRPLTDNIYSQKYVAYYINQMLKKKISTLAKGSSISNVYNSDLKKLNIVLPSLSEQEKIASFLSSVDSKIEQLSKKRTFLEQYKKGVMQKIFSQTLRFHPKGVSSQAHGKDDDGSEFPEWVEKKLGEIIVDYRLGGNYTNTEVISNHPLIKMGNLNRGKINISKLEYIKDGETVEEIDKIQYGDLFFNTRNTLDLVGKVAIWLNELPEAYYNSNLMYMKYENNFFMNYRLNSYDGIKALRSIATGTTSVAAIYTKDLLKIKLSIPSLKEQTKIANFLSSLDKKIELTDKELGATKEFKKALLQKMFV